MTFSPKDADAWYERNKHKLGQGIDPVTTIITTIGGMVPLAGRVFEFGCANGWRLSHLNNYYTGLDMWGSELSPAACRDADKRIKMNVEPAIASCDLVIMGFCMYLLQPGSLMYWAHYADKILADGGHLVIHDFLPDHPHARVFSHNTSLRSRKMDHGQLWLAHPAYSMVHRDIIDGSSEDDRTHVTILKKDMNAAFPLKEES